MRSMIAAIAFLLPFAAHAQTGQMLVYPAMRSAGAAYVVNTDSVGKIKECRAVEPQTVTDAAASCSALTAKGVPATVTPARSLNSPAKWITHNDVPQSVVRARLSGKTEIIFEVNEQGRISECRAYAASGSAEMDATACASMIARARFSPATYNGQPVRAIGITWFRFSAT